MDIEEIERQLLSVVTFDTDALRQAVRSGEHQINELEQRKVRLARIVEAYRRLLKYKTSQNGSRPSHGAGDNLDTTISESLRFREMTIREAAKCVLTEAGGKMHGRKMMEAMESGGLHLAGKSPMSSLMSILIRSDDFERVAGEPNVWKLTEK